MGCCSQSEKSNDIYLSPIKNTRNYKIHSNSFKNNFDLKISKSRNEIDLNISHKIEISFKEEKNVCDKNFNNIRDWDINNDNLSEKNIKDKNSNHEEEYYFFQPTPIASKIEKEDTEIFDFKRKNTILSLYNPAENVDLTNSNLYESEIEHLELNSPHVKNINVEVLKNNPNNEKFQSNSIEDTYIQAILKKLDKLTIRKRKRNLPKFN